MTGGYLSFNGGQVVNVEYGVSCGLRATLSQISVPVSNASDVTDPFSNVNYTVSGTYSIWVNKQAKDAGKKPVQVSTVYYGITSDQITQPPLALLYQYVQSKIYPNTTVA